MRVNDVSFALREGEILGVAGVAGNGQSELLEALAGIRPLSAGEILIDGEPLPPPKRNPHLERLIGIGHVPEDRHRVGLVMSFEACESAMLGFHHEPVYGKGLFFDRRAIIADAAQKMEAFDVRPRAPLLKTANFSGGNQQKIVLAREIERNPKILLVGQPTRGVDIGAIEFIHKRIVAQRDAGKALLLVSVELDEIFALSDRIIVLCAGRITGERRAGGNQRPGPRPPDGGRQRARGMSSPLRPLPQWADVALIPLVNVGAAFVISGLVVLAIGENPLEAVQILITGALGDLEGIGFTLYYATSFIFTGLAVAICFHAGLFNIGVEGQAYVAGLGAALAALNLGFLPGYSLVARGDPRRCPVRRGVRVHPGLSSGQARQPHRHYDDHVQLHRLGLDGLPAGRRSPRPGADECGDARIFGLRHRAAFL